MADGFMVFFRTNACNLDAAAKSLAGYGLTFARQGELLIAGRPRSPQFNIRLVSGPHVAIEAAEIGENTPHAANMRDCSERFEVNIDDLDAALDEINTLMEVQGALQDASQGFLFLPWNGNLYEPSQDGRGQRDLPSRNF